MEKILITGASGFVGKYLASRFLEKGHTVTGLGTSQHHPFDKEFENFTWIAADTTVEGGWQEKVPEADIIINLAGRSIFKPWTKAYRKVIHESRIMTTRHVTAAMENEKPKKFISASAVGYYGDRDDTILSETASRGAGFLPRVCQDWEAEALKAVDKGAAVSILRFGVVLGDGGALSSMGPVFKAFLGGPLGSGKQWFPWIHIQDLARGVEFIMEGAPETGTRVFNFTGPEPIRQKTFAKQLGRSLGRPAFMPAPGIMIKLLMGELGISLLQSQRALPTHLLDQGFTFRFKEADQALADIYKK